MQLFQRPRIKFGAGFDINKKQLDIFSATVTARSITIGNNKQIQNWHCGGAKHKLKVKIETDSVQGSKQRVVGNIWINYKIS